ncbi:hypothetical protein COL5a_006747 [Colletotrichum fioriniae]|uniref:uncharacterized protein n=1 Tax=Colletotrichum fioriniae TaxID=710243 RepID=UPI002300AAC9|nr:uncharacterized protein COL516b_008404 [Colletotrichum fioriniae]KAJ0300474.1 hypothetical protein COL516b_008404 [Colletotrichum fioriniae]KAJ0326562.1 hypothetical protein COL5a_006747 [Colletotrichum fioriniae]KAJ3949924.1 hypothetical protein N0V96_001059 [Colletotrichum fioriniae]
MDEDDSLAIDPEMAAFMGFASFGTQPAAKKRKYNHRTDAVSSATGANQTALAPRAPRPAPSTTTEIAADPAANADEIALNDDDEDDGTVAAVAAGTAAGEDVDAEEGGANLYTDPTVAPALAHAQSLIDELANRGAAPEDGTSAPQAQSTTSSLPTSSALPQRPDASWGKEMGSAPTTMPTRERSEQHQHQHQHQHQRGGRQGYQQQQRNDGKPWWEGYYDPASNENPWEKLEKKAGVLSKGTWVARGAQAQTA